MMLPLPAVRGSWTSLVRNPTHVLPPNQISKLLSICILAKVVQPILRVPSVCLGGGRLAVGAFRSSLTCPIYFQENGPSMMTFQVGM